jgi:hypothetical protein
VHFEECNNNDNKFFLKTQAGNVDPQLISSALYKMMTEHSGEAIVEQ